MSNKTEIKNCQNCKKDFIIEPDDFGFYTSYAPNRPEIVYCEDCYKQEVY